MRTGLFLFIFFLFINVSLSAQEGQYADINGIKMYYETYGDEDAEPLFLLHYWTNSSQLWKRHIPELEQNFRLIVPDLRGHGKSPADLENFVMRQSAEDILALMDHLGIQKAKAIGVSYGGFTLLFMADLAPERLESMILVGATHYLNEAQRAYNASWKWEEMKELPWVKNVTKLHVNGEEQMEMIIRKFTAFAEEYSQMNFTPDVLAKMKTKTLIVMGEKDPLGIDLAFEMHKHIPDSYLWIVPNAGHVAPVQGPRIPEFLRISKNFLSGKWK